MASLLPSASPLVGEMLASSDKLSALSPSPVSSHGVPHLFPVGDEIPQTEFVSEVIAIKYAKASEIADALNSLSSDGEGNEDRIRRLMRRALASGEPPNLCQTKIIAEKRTNSLLVFATRSDMERIKSILPKLDVVLPQILIEALIFEIKLSDSQSLGWRHVKRTVPGRASPLFRSGVITNVNLLWLTNFVASTTTNATRGQSAGFCYVGGLDKDLDSITTALAGDNRINITLKPRLMTFHGLTGRIFVGTTDPVQVPVRIGVDLQLTPLIRADGSVVFNICQSVDTVTGTIHINGVGEVPNTISTESVAKVKLRDHETIMIGGMTRIVRHEQALDVPFLKKIPMLEAAFRNLTAYRTRSEVVVLLRATVLPNEQYSLIP